jgi:putative ABC transport system permease protein
MLYNYLKQAWRSLVKNKTYTVLNIAGLTAGLTCFAFIALWVKDELSYDKFNEKYDRIVRLTGSVKTESGTMESAVSSAPMAQALKNDYPEVESTVRFDMHGEIVEHKGQKTHQSNILVTDPSFFGIFSYHLTRGNAATALLEPYSIILTESTARKYFGSSDPLGETLKIFMYDSAGFGALYKVTGVMPDPPENSHFSFTMLASFKTVEVANPDVLTADGWGDASFYTYLLLKEGVDQVAFSAKVSQFYEKYIGDMFKVWRSIYFYKLQPLRDIHLRSNLQYEIAPTGNINHIYIFTTVGIFILLLAGINYVNLATARSMNRAKEISIKKVVGAGKNQLILQYLLEAVVTALIAFVVSLVLCLLLQPILNQLTGRNLSPLASPVLLAALIGVTIILGVLSGIYPAVLISRFKPAGILKGSFKAGTTGVMLRKSLVVTQFTITLVLITSIIIIHSQMSYIKHKDLGYEKNALLFLRVHGDSDVIDGYEAFKNELSSNVLISGISTSNSLPVGGLGTGGSETVDINGHPIQVNTARLRIDPDYLDVYGIKLIAGRNFSKNRQVDDTTRSVILNEAAVKNFGWKNPETAIGKPFRMGNQQGFVIGVVKDFHFNSLQQAIEPLAMFLREDRFSRITLKVDISKARQSIAWIEKTWKKHFPSALLDYGFLDRHLGEQYQAEEQFSRIFLYFSVLSLLIACFGLYGLISFAASQKTKEIGIRKVLGATVNGIVLMLSRDFLKLVGLAFLVAAPLAWLIMNNWLEDFAYRTNISWWMFAVSGVSVMMVAFITISFQSIKAAIANPVKSLRTE